MKMFKQRDCDTGASQIKNTKLDFECDILIN